MAFCDEAVDIFVATDLEVGTRHLDEAESIDVEIYTLEELCDMIYEGKIQDGKTIAAIMAYAQQKKAEWENIWIYKNGIKKTDRA